MMIQDINEKYDLDYYDIKPEENDYVLAYGIRLIVLDNNNLIKYNKDYKGDLVYGFRIGKSKFFIDRNTYTEGEAINVFRKYPNRCHAFAMTVGYHLWCWYNKNRFCGMCGSKTFVDTKERKLVCSCKNEIYPTIAPAVIVGIIHNDKIVMTKYLTGYSDYALVAGFSEIGESFEDTVRREVKEEVGLNVGKIVYYKSQPWGLAGDILAGYYAYLADDNTNIVREEDELKEARWFTRDEIELQDDNSSLTREMIMNFKRGNI